MSANGAIRKAVVITNPNGLHLRFATTFVKAARQVRSVVAVWNGDRRADGRSVFDLVGLMAMPGAEVVLEVEGEDADQAAEQLLEILASPGDGF